MHYGGLVLDWTPFGVLLGTNVVQLAGAVLPATLHGLDQPHGRVEDCRSKYLIDPSIWL